MSGVFAHRRVRFEGIERERDKRVARVECLLCGQKATRDLHSVRNHHGCAVCAQRWKGFQRSAFGRSMLELIPEEPRPELDFSMEAMQRWWCRRRAAEAEREVEA